MRSYDKLNALHLHLQKTHEHQTRQSADLPWEAPNQMIFWLRDQHVVTWKFEKFLSPLSQDLATKPGKVLSYRRRFSIQSLKSSPISCLCLKQVDNTRTSTMKKWIYKLVRNLDVSFSDKMFLQKHIITMKLSYMVMRKTPH